ncbi:MAG: Bifunctional protein GlmU [Chlamydiae bacterium]|nr:Bifunctional protein GlmU [Chlamydiota bacterium]
MLIDMLLTQKYFSDVGFLQPFFEKCEYVHQILECFEEIFAHVQFEIHPDAIISDKAIFENRELICIEEGVVIEPYAYLKGPCFIGKHSIVRHGAYVREQTVCLENTLIGHSSEIKSSILLKGAKAAHFNYVGNSILGCDVNLGAGSICSNFRLDKGPVPIKLDGEVILGPTKLGAIIGDKSQIGCNCVLNPGTFLAPQSVCYPNSTLKGFHVC